MKRTFLIAFACLSIALVGCESKGGGSSAPPPDQGSKEPLEGIDSDNNGVRDDIEKAILEFAPDPEQEEQRSALRQIAKGFQASVLAGDSNDTQEALKAWETLSKGLNCLSEKYPDGGERTASILIETATTNTDERLFAYWRFNELLSGQIFEYNDDSNPCD
ncbi:MAG: hypothetical protein LBQ52_00680 [Helicobacteraceae bacterium]|jgi:hypothetical protein|nr:hypothetical protein [Helicobacteraceae bacterium]